MVSLVIVSFSGIIAVVVKRYNGSSSHEAFDNTRVDLNTKSKEESGKNTKSSIFQKVGALLLASGLILLGAKVSQATKNRENYEAHQSIERVIESPSSAISSILVGEQIVVEEGTVLRSSPIAMGPDKFDIFDKESNVVGVVDTDERIVIDSPVIVKGEKSSDERYVVANFGHGEIRFVSTMALNQAIDDVSDRRVVGVADYSDELTGRDVDKLFMRGEQLTVHSAQLQSPLRVSEASIIDIRG